MFRDLKKFCDNPRVQHNIVALVGNGFDIAAMSKYSCGKMKGKKPSYEEFYAYMTYYSDSTILSKNLIYDEMTKAKASGNNKAWSDFELIVDKLCRQKGMDFVKLRTDLDFIQDWFSKFLNDLITADSLIAINNDSSTKGLAIQSVSKFLGDLRPTDNLRMDFLKRKKHIYFDVYSFLFVDFNYSMLLDNYIYLDRKQFDPHKYKNVDRNFNFMPAPQIPRFLQGYNEDTEYSTYLYYDIVHPHGYMDIPRSIIFGTELENYDVTSANTEKLFVKSYWARDDIRYSEYFDSAELFIVFGMSITKTDAWWFDKIYKSLLDGKAELIIYNYISNLPNSETSYELASDEVKERFIKACIINGNNSADNETVRERIYVVHMNKNDTYFLGFESKN